MLIRYAAISHVYILGIIWFRKYLMVVVHNQEVPFFLTFFIEYVSAML